jgi:DNA polymerase sigma
MKSLESMHMLAAALANSGSFRILVQCKLLILSDGMDRVVCVAAAKVPIVKIWDPELQLASDMNVNNTLAIENTRMIKTYVQIDDRVRLLAMIIKHWTKRRILNDAGKTLLSIKSTCSCANAVNKGLVEL